jgi:hypothetical protein
MNKILFTTIFIAAFLNNVTSNVNPENVVAAINCGGEEFRDSDGILYEKVMFYNIRITITMGVKAVTLVLNLISS